MEEAPPPAPVAQCLEEPDVPSMAKVGSTVAFKVKACRDGDVTLHYRAAGASSWFRKAMTKRVGVRVAMVPLDETFAEGMEWFIAAEGVSVGSASKPSRIAVSP